MAKHATWRGTRTGVESASGVYMIFRVWGEVSSERECPVGIELVPEDIMTSEDNMTSSEQVRVNA